MKEITLESKIKLFLFEELDSEEQRLVNLAKDATNNSYSPYSNFAVGAAIRLADGREMIGANQENAAFPVGLCAERSAIYAAQSQFPDQPIVAIAIAAKNAQGFMNDPISPCGSCRQVMIEMEQRYKRTIKIYLYGTKGTYVINSIKDLMPLSFVDESMK